MSLNIKCQTGTGLIEVLVAMLIVAIGSLSLLSMQVTGKKVSYDAIQRSAATALVHDIVERMRNNPNSLASYVVDDFGNGSITSEPSPNCVSATCTATQLAAHDMWEWEQNLDGAVEQLVEDGSTFKVGGLVSPRACITHSAGVVTVALVWKGYQELSNPVGSTCGEGLGLYGGSEVQRQMMFVTTYIEEV